MPRVRMLAADADVDLPDAIPLPFGDVVDQVELPRLLEKPWIGPDVGEHEPPAAIDVADQVEVGVHPRLVEVLPPLELEVPLEELVLELAVADEGDVADGVSRPLADHERQVRPVAGALVNHLHLAAHLGLEESEAAVVGRQRLDVLLDDRPVDVAADQPKHPRLRLDLREQPRITGDRVANETRPERLAVVPLVDQEHGPLVSLLVALDGRDPRRLVALLLVVRFDPPPGFFDHVGIHRVADVDLRLFAERAGGDPLVADVFHIPQHRPLDDLEDHHDAFGHADILGVHVDELPRLVQRADVFFDRLGVEDLAGAGDEFGELRDVGGVVALNPHLDDDLARCSRGCRLGRDGGQRQRFGRRLGDRHGCREPRQEREQRPRRIADREQARGHRGWGARVAAAEAGEE